MHLHMLSPKSKGLFHRAASHSGTVLSPWAFSYSGKEQALRLAKALDCPVNGSAHDVLNCMTAVDVHKIAEEHFENLVSGYKLQYQTLMGISYQVNCKSLNNLFKLHQLPFLFV